MHRRRAILLALVGVAVALPGCAHLQGAGPRWGWDGFLAPATDANCSRLVGPERHERGRVPVVLVHGLLATADTWDVVIAELERDPVIAARYEFWTFEYPTGKSYLETAARFRADLRAAVANLDAVESDPALDHMVLVGHSMGGLVAKLQVTHSGDELWQAVSDRPFDEFNAEAETRRGVESALFFEPLPFVERVVFIGTPHRGSSWTGRPLGRLGRWLIDVPDAAARAYERVVQDNADVLRDPSASPVPPSSIDHLRPDDPLLLATSTLPFEPRVDVHSIVGTGRRLPNGAPGDGVVSIASARLGDRAHESTIPAPHVWLHRDRRTIDSLRRILAAAPTPPPRRHRHDVDEIE